MEEVSRLISEGKPVTDPALLKRIYERSEEVQRQMQENYGVVEWAVDLIRVAREFLNASGSAQNTLPPHRARIPQSAANQSQLALKYKSAVDATTLPLWWTKTE